MSTTPTSIPGAAPQTPPPARPSNAVWWVLGIFVLAIVVVFGGGLLTAGYFLRHTRVNETAGRVEISTPGGKISVRASDSVRNVGLPLYPGATQAERGAGVEVTTPDDRRVGVNAVKYRTTDPAEKVDAWYRERLGGEFERRGPGESITDLDYGSIHVERNDIGYLSKQPGLILVVAIKKLGSSLTEIDLVRVGKSQAQ